MPELPEVETVLRTLEKQIKDKKIIDVKVLYKNIVVGDSEEFKNRLINQSFRCFKRRGKYLLFEMDDFTLVSHLRMEGKYYILNENDPIDKHTHIIFVLDNNKELRYHDVRKFGRMEIVDKEDKYDCFKGLGKEPFDESLNIEYCKSYLKNKHLPIKQVLLSQDFIAGIGNIYADEILFSASINPLKKANKINDEEINNIISSTRIILKKAIKKGGTTIRSYTSSLGVTGLFQLELNVHTKDICHICGNQIKKIRVGGRGTYYCPVCQK